MCVCAPFCNVLCPQALLALTSRLVIRRTLQEVVGEGYTVPQQHHKLIEVQPNYACAFILAQLLKKAAKEVGTRQLLTAGCTVLCLGKSRLTQQRSQCIAQCMHAPQADLLRHECYETVVAETCSIEHQADKSHGMRRGLGLCPRGF